MNSPSAPVGNTWLMYTMLTVFSWGVYGILLHKGQVFMGDPVNGRYKAFLFVGIAYFLTAVLAPLFLLMTKTVALTGKSAAFSGYTGSGMWWSLIAGIAGAIGAFGCLLAFGAKGSPAVVMAIVFGGAPVVNAIVALILTRNEIDFSKVDPRFYLGLCLALVGGGLVTRYKPNPAPKKAPAAQVSPQSAPKPAV